MLVGHYSAAFLAKWKEPRLPLWLLAIAVQAVDVLWAAFVLAGVEHLRVDPTLASNPLVLYDMPYTHSLAGALGWSLLAAAILMGWRRDLRCSLVLGAAVASHWLLDFLVHRPDLPLWSGSFKVGLGLWDHPAAAFALEAVLLLASSLLLLRGRTGTERLRRGLVTLVAALLLLQLFLTIGPPPVGPMGVAGLALLIFAGVAWGASRLEPAADAAGG